ncbi:hypothetical protein E8E14_006235 [Neopestalotiopsis sp. 37M]|nr:hypothetical protein E8E14_006235 [Neopestalotiopsis sp. 37M]
MAFGVYNSKHAAMRKSSERPLLSIPSSSSTSARDDFEYEVDRTILRHEHRQRRKAQLVTICRNALIGVLLLVVMLQTAILHSTWLESKDPRPLEEINSLVPSVRSSVKIFRADPDFDPLNATDTRWMDVMPAGGGFISVDDLSDKSLPPPIRSRGKNLYNVAVYHQLHCLHMLAEEFSNLLGNNKHVAHEDMSDELMMWHIRHCFEYLKNSLTCCADTALEGQKSDTDEPATDGFGAYHVCRDFDSVYDWAREHRISDQGGYPHGTA